VLLGLSEDAVRSRLKRGTLRKEKDADGRVFVALGANGRPGRPATDESALALMQAHLDSLGEQLTYLRYQLDREREANHENRRIIAGLVQRVPELGPAHEPRDIPGTAAREQEGVDPRPATEGAQGASEPRSWWRRFFGF
jgi:hypothetical protein